MDSTSERDIEFLQLNEQELAKLKDFTEKLKASGEEGVYAHISESVDCLQEAELFVHNNPRIASKIIQGVNKNPELVKKLRPELYEEIKQRFPIEATEYYIPPMIVTDPIDPVAALPAALAVAVVAAGLMFVGRGALRGVI